MTAALTGGRDDRRHEARQLYEDALTLQQRGQRLDVTVLRDF